MWSARVQERQGMIGSLEGKMERGGWGWQWSPPETG